MARGRSPTDPLRGITRFDYHKRGQDLWWVRFQRGTKGNGELTSKTFPDSKWGGKRKALKAAQLWRDRTERELRAPIQPNPEKAPGYGYVKRTTVQQRGSQSDVWVAWLRVLDRRCKATKYSIVRWGSAEAKRRAEQWLVDKRNELGLTDPDRPAPRRRPPPPPAAVTPKRKKNAKKKRGKKRARRVTRKPGKKRRASR